MTTWQADVARARWRADLLDYGAAGHEGFGDTSTADQKRAEAERMRAFADANEEYENAIHGLDRNSDEFRRAQEKFVAARLASRMKRLDEGVSVAVVNNFPEPSDDELLGATKKGGK